MNGRMNFTSFSSDNSTPRYEMPVSIFDQNGKYNRYMAKKYIDQLYAWGVIDTGEYDRLIKLSKNNQGRFVIANPGLHPELLETLNQYMHTEEAMKNRFTDDIEKKIESAYDKKLITKEDKNHLKKEMKNFTSVSQLKEFSELLPNRINEMTRTKNTSEVNKALTEKVEHDIKILHNRGILTTKEAEEMLNDVESIKDSYSYTSDIQEKLNPIIDNINSIAEANNLYFTDNNTLVVNRIGDPIGGSNTGNTSESGNTSEPGNIDNLDSQEYMNNLARNAYSNYANLMLDPQDQQANTYMQMMNNAIDAEQQAYNNELAGLEMEAYRQIGLQQQELENQIAENRLKAIKSGTTSAQLAAQQLNNMFAAQSGAVTIAQNAMNKRLEAAQNYNTMRNTGLTSSLFDTINANKTTHATAGAQNLASTSSYSSYINQHAANLQASGNYAKANPELYKQILGN